MQPNAEADIVGMYSPGALDLAPGLIRCVTLGKSSTPQLTNGHKTHESAC